MEEMEKKAGNAEGEVSGLRSRLILLQVSAIKYQFCGGYYFGYY